MVSTGGGGHSGCACPSLSRGRYWQPPPHRSPVLGEAGGGDLGSRLWVQLLPTTRRRGGRQSWPVSYRESPSCQRLHSHLPGLLHFSPAGLCELCSLENVCLPIRGSLIGRCTCELPFGNWLVHTWECTQAVPPHCASTALIQTHTLTSACPVSSYVSEVPSPEDELV